MTAAPDFIHTWISHWLENSINKNYEYIWVSIINVHLNSSENQHGLLF